MKFSEYLQLQIVVRYHPLKIMTHTCSKLLKIIQEALVDCIKMCGTIKKYKGKKIFF
jgi:hypothetical protein